MPLTRICPRCGVSYAKSTRFCSRPCYAASNVGTAHPKHKPKTQRSCEQCGSSFETYPYLERRFCSRSCRSRWINANLPRRLRSAPRVTFPCPICGQAVTVLASRGERVKTCSAACGKELSRRHHEGNRQGEMRTCEMCGRPFYMTASRIREGQAGRFCSPKCNGTWRTT